jgi:hypothetical protein
MQGFILFLHFFGLMLGAAGGFASGFIMMRANSAPADQAQTLRALGWPLAMMSGTGLLILWITGIILLIMAGGPGVMPTVFWWKILFVVIVTVLIGLTHRIYAEMRRTGIVALGERLKAIGPATGLSLLLVVLFAAYAFN